MISKVNREYAGKIYLLLMLNGLRARWGFEVAVEWGDGKVTQSMIKLLNGKTCQLKGVLKITLPDGTAINTRQENGCTCFNTQTGTVYKVSPVKG